MITHAWKGEGVGTDTNKNIIYKKLEKLNGNFETFIVNTVQCTGFLERRRHFEKSSFIADGKS